MVRSLALILAAGFALMASDACSQTYTYSSPSVQYNQTYQTQSRYYATNQRFARPRNYYARNGYRQSSQRVSRPTYTTATPRSAANGYYQSAPQNYGSSYAGGVSNVFSMLNAQRTRQGAPALQYDATLQAVAERRARQMASMGLKNHPPGSFSPGRFEGVGWSSSYSPKAVSACYINDTRMRAAGAAMARGSDGVYFAVVYR